MIKTEFPCVICGTMFPCWPSKYNNGDKQTCSRECAIANRTKNNVRRNENGKYEFPCRICTKLFEVDAPNLYNNGFVNTCSSECSTLYRSKKIKESKPKTKFPCDVCGEDFEVIACKYNNGIKRTCSKECSKIKLNEKSENNKKPDKITNCIICNKEYPLKYLSNYMYEKKETCSKECNIKNLSRLQAGISRPYLYNSIIEIPNNLKEIIDGEMLGDGSLEMSKVGVAPNARFCYGTSCMEYIVYIRKQLGLFGTSEIVTGTNNREGSITHKFRTMNNPSLTNIYNRWYPEGKKIIPKDLELTPLVIKHWFLGDGSLRQHSGGIVLYTNGFEVSDVEFLVKLLNNLNFISNLRMTYSKEQDKYYPIIYISTRSTGAFLKYIGECPVEYYKYKWNVDSYHFERLNYPYTLKDIGKEIGKKHTNYNNTIERNWCPKDINFRKICNEYRFDKESFNKILNAYNNFKGVK